MIGSTPDRLLQPLNLPIVAWDAFIFQEVRKLNILQISRIKHLAFEQLVDNRPAFCAVVRRSSRFL